MLPLFSLSRGHPEVARTFCLHTHTVHIFTVFKHWRKNALMTQKKEQLLYVVESLMQWPGYVKEEILICSRAEIYKHTHTNTSHTHIFKRQLQRPRGIFFHKSISSGERDRHTHSKGYTGWRYSFHTGISMLINH